MGHSFETVKGKGKKYTFTAGEEAFHSASHALGAVVFLVGGVMLIRRALNAGGLRSLAAALIYSASLVLLYTMSSLYHGIQKPGLKRGFWIMDHCSIYVLIAGSYTPFMLIALGGTALGNGVLAFEWLICLIGIALGATHIDTAYRYSVILQAVMGWAICVVMGPVHRALPAGAIWLLVAGGLSYTIGIGFYLSPRRYMHSVWHVFVLGGSILHYACIYAYLF